ncbi:MAG: hypothetical protein MUC60_12180 [Oscillatoria sp. Prado101]|jgi:hypothetical protein|nr:hypothetical protein [Oscillatoria sp. Prado101]
MVQERAQPERKFAGIIIGTTAGERTKLLFRHSLRRGESGVRKKFGIYLDKSNWAVLF